MRPFLLALLWCGVLTGSAFAQETANGGLTLKESATKPADRPMSIFNEEIRRFRFEIEHTLVTDEVTQAFMAKYSTPENPKIIGAYADTTTNSLVVVGPPEAEPAIRKSLAVWMVQTANLGNPPSFEVQKRQLQDDRAIFLMEMAVIEIAVVDAKEAHREQAAIELNDRLASMEKELQITERKLEVVKKYMKRLEEIKE